MVVDHTSKTKQHWAPPIDGVKVGSQKSFRAGKRIFLGTTAVVDLTDDVEIGAQIYLFLPSSTIKFNITNPKK